MLARAPARGGCKRQLEPLLGREGCVGLQSVLIRRAARWAGEVAPGAAHLCFSPPEAEADMRALELSGVSLAAQPTAPLGARLAACVAGCVGERCAPILLVGVDVPALASDHAVAVLDDLAHGCQVSFGPTTDGGCYLLGLARRDPSMLSETVGDWSRGQLMAKALERVTARGPEIALLRAERELHAPGDARALLADPLAPEDVASALGASAFGARTLPNPPKGAH